MIHKGIQIGCPGAHLSHHVGACSEAEVWTVQGGMKGEQQTRKREKDCFHTVPGACLTKKLQRVGSRGQNSGLPLPASCSHHHDMEPYCSTGEEWFFHPQLTAFLGVHGNLLANRDLSPFNSKKDIKLDSGACPPGMKVKMRSRKARKVVCRLRGWQSDLQCQPPPQHQVHRPATSLAKLIQTPAVSPIS